MLKSKWNINEVVNKIINQTNNDGHVTLYLNPEKKECARLIELLSRHNIIAEKIVGGYVIFYPDRMTEENKKRLMIRETENLKKSNPKLFKVKNKGEER